MNCIKCGKNAPGASEFCDECLADMALHPVKPGTPVILPKQESQQIVKHGRKRALKPEQQLQMLRHSVRILLAVTILLLLLLLAAVLVILELTGTSTTSLLPVNFLQTEQAIVSRETIFYK